MTKRHAAGEWGEPPAKRSTARLYMPNELWEMVLTFAPTWDIAVNLARCNWALYTELQHLPVAHLQKYLRERTDRAALEQCTSDASRRAVLWHRCQLCERVCHRGRVSVQWPLFTHQECLSRELITLSAAMRTYDFTFEQLVTLPQLNRQVWKYHGGRPQLPFSVADTLQGLCLRVHHECLYDRRARIGALREQLVTDSQAANAADVARTTLMNHLTEEDVRAEQAARQQRLGAAVESRRRHLEPLLKTHRLHAGLAKAVRTRLYSCVRMPISWQQLDAVLVELARLSTQWTAKHTKMLARQERLVLRPKVLREALDRGTDQGFRAVLEEAI